MTSSQRLMLGETCLDDYVSGPIELEEARKKEIDGLIAQIEERVVLNVEKYPLQLLKNESKLLELQDKYKQLDPSFLSMSNIINYKGNQIKVPRFSVYPKGDEGFEEFSFKVGLLFHSFYYGGFGNGYGSAEMSRIPKIFEKPLFQSSPLFEFFKQNTENALPRELYKKYKSMFKLKRGIRIDIKFSSRFTGIFPKETKEKLSEAETIFDKELYLIAETKPEEWNVQVVKSDPLLTGVHKGKCFLVNKFDTTSIEEYVSKEFTF